MQYTIEGSTMQSLHVELQSGQIIYSDTGALMHMSTNVEMETRFQGGIGGMFKRAVGGNSVALNYFTARSGPGEVSFSTRMPGHILPVGLGNTDIVVQRHSFLCASETVDLQLQTSFNFFGVFGGNGLVFNRLSGAGMAFLSIDGEVIEKELNHGDSLLIHPTHLAAYESTVRADLQKMSGVKNMLFGGDGLALIRVTGPGKVWMHSISIGHLAELLSQYMPHSK